MISANARPKGFPIISVVGTILAILFLVTGCSTPSGKPPTAEDAIPPLLRLAEGDIIELSFPGATNLNSVHRIGPEGTINLPLIGPTQASGVTSEQLQAQLTEAYKNELKDASIIVSVANSANAVYVTGAVLRPGRIPLNRPLTALEAIMETGGFQEVANREKVTIVRYIGNKNTTIEVNLEPILSGGPVPPTYVKPRDIIHVPTKIQWF